MLKLTRRHRWLLVAGVATAVAEHLTDRVVRASWRLAARKDPPEDPALKDVKWTTALLWTAAAGAIVAVSEVVARHGAGLAWKRVTGRKPPRPRRRPRVRSR